MTPRKRASTSGKSGERSKVDSAVSTRRDGAILKRLRLPAKATLTLPGDVTTLPGTRRQGQGKKK